MKHWIFLAIFLQITPDILLNSHFVEFSYVEPRNETVKTFVSDLTNFPRENYEWNYIYLNIIETEKKDTIIGVEYCKKDDFYSARAEEGEHRLYTISGKDTIFIQGDLSLFFFMPSSCNPKIGYKIDETNVLVEFLPSKLFYFNSWIFEEKESS
jgi:hypothetical protein